METGPGPKSTAPSELPSLPRRRWHRGVFVAAGIYNVAWGIYAAIDPQWLFRFAGMPLDNHPQIFACLGMVIGLYGILYFEIARAPERGWLLASVGLGGKVLGPIGLLALIWKGTWPPAASVLCVTNDFIWWLPYLYLRDAWPHFRSSLRAN
jgi:hypothetical protein